MSGYALGVMQTIFAALAGYLLGDDVAHQFGIFFALWCLTPVVYGKE